MGKNFLQVISDPNIAYILLILGINALIYEITSPGAIFPGVAGAICIVLALYTMAMLSMNYFGVALIIFAFVLFFAEIKIQSHGILLAGGIISMILGSIILMNAGPSNLSVSWPTVIATVGVTTAFFVFVISKAAAALHRRASTGQEGLVGSQGTARTEIAPEGTVFAQGELWSAMAENGPIPRGSKVIIVGVRGLKLVVRKA